MRNVIGRVSEHWAALSRATLYMLVAHQVVTWDDYRITATLGVLELLGAIAWGAKLKAKAAENGDVFLVQTSDDAGVVDARSTLIPQDENDDPDDDPPLGTIIGFRPRGQ